MFRCDSCAAVVSAVDENGDGLACGCWRHNPLERAAAALFDDSREATGWGRHDWDAPALDATDARLAWRRKADAALRAAIDVDELAEHIGPEHAAIVHTHLLGSAAP